MHRRPTHASFYITFTLETIYSGLSKRNFNDHYGEAVKKTMSGYIVEINEFSVSDEML